MFGFIQANINDLSEYEKQRYKAAYCGLCHVLGEKYGLKGRLSLSYDLTFLLLLLTSLYEPDEISGESRCVVHPMKKHSFFTNKYTEYAADMTIALTYHKCLDDWNDDKKASAKKYASMLEKSYNDIKNKWRVQISVMENELDFIKILEENNDLKPDLCANAFGRIMAAVFVPEKDNWESYLGKIGYDIGRYIYLADAAVDLEKDKKNHSYNPLVNTIEKAEDMRPMLMSVLGGASDAFEKLPIEKDIVLLRNILYSGLWIKFNEGVSRERKGEENGK